MNTWFTGDTHFGHGNIIKYCKRPFLVEKDQELLKQDPGRRVSQESVEFMDEHLIDQINRCVKPEDSLYHVGDFLFARRDQYFGMCNRLLQRINCKNIFLIWGNHDHISIKPLFRFTGNMMEIRIEDQNIVLCHYALAIWNKSHHGAWHLYGHSHGGAESRLDAALPGRRSIDVGVDNAKVVLGEYRPFQFEELKKIMGSRSGCAVDHHE